MMAGRRRLARRWPVLLLALPLGLGLHAGPVPESLGRWIADPAWAVVLESACIRQYLTMRPRVGERISTALFIARAEGEDVGAAAYRARQQMALRLTPTRLRPEGVHPVGEGLSASSRKNSPFSSSYPKSSA